MATIWARREVIWWAKSLLDAYPQSIAEAIAAGDLTEAQVEQARNFTEGFVTQQQVSRIIDGAHKHMQDWGSWRDITAQKILAEAYYRCAKEKGWRRAHRSQNDAVLDWVEKNVSRLQTGPVERLHFGPRGRRKDREEAITAFFGHLSKIRDEVNKKLAADSYSQVQTAPSAPEPEVKQPTHVDVPEDIEEFADDAPVEDEDEQESESDPDIEVVDENNPIKADAEWLNRFINNAWLMTEDMRNPVTGDTFATVGFRWYIPSAQLIVQGIPAKFVASNLTRTWPLEAKRTLWECNGVKFRNNVYIPDSDQTRANNPWDYDPNTFEPNPDIPGVRFMTEQDHKAMGLALVYLHTERKAWLIGPPGTGKTHMVGGCADKFAKELGKEFPYVVLSLTRATSPSAFYGKQRIDGTSLMIEYLHANNEGNKKLAAELTERAKVQGDVTISLFEKILRSGGIVGLDEADRADPNTMQMLNAVIAQRHFVNTVSQREFDLSPDTMFMMMTNTEGTGASAAHNTADKMDDATVDRFAAVRLYVGLDQDLANREYWRIINSVA